MPPVSATLDAFSAIAEPRRRELLVALGGDERSVGEIERTLRWTQPQVSKHLGVLRRTGLVRVRRDGKKSMYSVNAQELKSVHDWVTMFERYWDQHLLRIKERAERAAGGTPDAPSPSSPIKPKGTAS
jgi:DNA-binding transcriptional ArsR family regulator